MTGPYTITESEVADGLAETAEMTGNSLDRIIAMVEADPAYQERRRAEVERAFAIVEADLRALGTSIDLVIDEDGVALAVWPKLGGGNFRVRVSGTTSSLLQAIENVKSEATR